MKKLEPIRLAVIGGQAIAPGASGPVQLVLERPTVALPGDRFIIRTFSPGINFCREILLGKINAKEIFIGENFKFGKDAKGVLLEIKKEKSTNYIEAILYDGELKKSDEIAIANFDSTKEPIVTKIRDDVRRK